MTKQSQFKWFIGKGYSALAAWSVIKLFDNTKQINYCDRDIIRICNFYAKNPINDVSLREALIKWSLYSSTGIIH